MSGKNKLPKWEVTQSKKLKNYSSYKEICPPWIKDSPCYYLVMVDFIFFNAANNKGMGNVFFFVTKNQTNKKPLEIYLAILYTEDCKCLS